MKIKNIYYYFKMLRTKDWMKIFFWIPLIGAFLANASLKNFILIAIIYFCAIGYSFVINNYFDIEIDKKHKRKIQSNINPLAKEFITKRGTLTLLGILLLVPIFLSLQINFIGFILVLLNILFFTFYSAKYIRLKEKPFIDIMTHGLAGGFFPFLAGITLAGGNINLLSILIGIFFSFVMANELLIHQITDYEDDLKNTNTTVIKIGLKMSYFCLISFFIISILCFGIMLEYFSVGQYVYLLFIFLLFWLFFYYIRNMFFYYKRVTNL